MWFWLVIAGVTIAAMFGGLAFAEHFPTLGEGLPWSNNEPAPPVTYQDDELS